MPPRLGHAWREIGTAAAEKSRRVGWRFRYAGVAEIRGTRLSGPRFRRPITASQLRRLVESALHPGRNARRKSAVIAVSRGTSGTCPTASFRVAAVHRRLAGVIGAMPTVGTSATVPAQASPLPYARGETARRWCPARRRRYPWRVPSPLQHVRSPRTHLRQRSRRDGAARASALPAAGRARNSGRQGRDGVEVPRRSRRHRPRIGCAMDRALPGGAAPNAAPSAGQPWPVRARLRPRSPHGRTALRRGRLHGRSCRSEQAVRRASARTQDATRAKDERRVVWIFPRCSTVVAERGCQCDEGEPAVAGSPSSLRRRITNKVW